MHTRASIVLFVPSVPHVYLSKLILRVCVCVPECECDCVLVSVCQCARVCVFMRRTLVYSTFFAPSSSNFCPSVRVCLLAHICVRLPFDVCVFLSWCACVLFVNYVLFQCQKVSMCVPACLRLGSTALCSALRCAARSLASLLLLLPFPLPSACHAGYINTHTQIYRRPTNTHAACVCVCVHSVFTKIVML